MPITGTNLQLVAIRGEIDIPLWMAASNEDNDILTSLDHVVWVGVGVCGCVWVCVWVSGREKATFVAVTSGCSSCVMVCLCV